MKKIKQIRLVKPVDNELPDYLVDYSDGSMRLFSTL